MAKFSQQFLAQTASPTFGRGLFDLAQNIGGLGAMRSQNEAAERQKQQESELMNYISALSQKALPPAGMTAQRESLLQSGISLDKILAAENVGAKQRARGIAGLEARQENINEQAKEARRRQLEKNAVNKAVTLKRPNDAAALAGADEATLRSYLMEKPGESPDLDITEQTILVNGIPTVVQVSTDPKTGKVVSTNTIGEAQATGKTDKTTLGQLLKDAGFEGNLSTLEGVKKARQFALLDLSNASLAGELADLEKQMTPFSLQQSIETVRAISPDFEEAESMLEKTERYRALDELNDQDIAGLTALLERTITSTTENDLKAVAELSRFRSSKDLVQRIKDFTTMTISGELSTETLTEYRQIMDAVDALSRRRVLRAADQTILLGSEREAEAAKKVRALYETEDNQARWVN